MLRFSVSCLLNASGCYFERSVCEIDYIKISFNIQISRIMERRKCNEAYAKLLIKEQKCSDYEENENVEATTFKRTNSVRASLRRLKGKLHAPSALQSPFTIRGPLSLRSKQIIKRNLKTSDKSYAAKRHSTVLKMYETCEDLSSVALISNDKKRKNINEQERYSIQNKTEVLLNKDCGIDLLMSGLPVGPVPRKACKLLQIPETYCLKYLEELKHVQQQKQSEATVECKNNNKENILQNSQATIKNKENSFESCEKISREGIYGSTRLRTATIRKPVPYLNSSRLNFLLIYTNIRKIEYFSANYCFLFCFIAL